MIGTSGQWDNVNNWISSVISACLLVNLPNSCQMEFSHNHTDKPTIQQTLLVTAVLTEKGFLEVVQEMPSHTLHPQSDTLLCGLIVPAQIFSKQVCKEI